MLAGFIKGIIVNIGLVSTLGPQNVTLVHLGFNKNYVYTFASICVACDVFLIFFSIFSPFVFCRDIFIIEMILTIISIVFLYYFAFKNFINSLFHSRVVVATDQKIYSRKNIISMGFIFSLLNPAILGETLIIIGGVSKQFLKIEDMISFLIGTMLASCIWFFGMAFSLKKTSFLMRNNKFFMFFYMVSGIFLFMIASLLIESLYVKLSHYNLFKPIVL